MPPGQPIRNVISSPWLRPKINSAATSLFNRSRLKSTRLTERSCIAETRFDWDMMIVIMRNSLSGGGDVG